MFPCFLCFSVFICVIVYLVCLIVIKVAVNVIVDEMCVVCVPNRKYMQFKLQTFGYRT